MIIFLDKLKFSILIINTIYIVIILYLTHIIFGVITSMLYFSTSSKLIKKIDKNLIFYFTFFSLKYKFFKNFIENIFFYV